MCARDGPRTPLVYGAPWVSCLVTAWNQGQLRALSPEAERPPAVPTKAPSMGLRRGCASRNEVYSPVHGASVKCSRRSFSLRRAGEYVPSCPHWNETPLAKRSRHKKPDANQVWPDPPRPVCHDTFTTGNNAFAFSVALSRPLRSDGLLRRRTRGSYVRTDSSSSARKDISPGPGYQGPWPRRRRGRREQRMSVCHASQASPSTVPQLVPVAMSPSHPIQLAQ